MKIGKYNLKVINSGFFALDGGTMFGVIPKPLWEKTNPPDEANRIKLSARTLFLESDSKKIIIDTGMGEKWDDKSKKIFKIDYDNYSLLSGLKEMNLSPEDITDVILTHLHFDHTGGSTKREGGKIIPAFTNAKYHVSKKNFDWALNPSERDKGSYLKDSFLPLKEEEVLDFLDDRFDDEISFIEVNGHTFGQQLVKITDASNTVLFCGDLFPTASHIRLPYIMAYDLQPLVTLEEKKKILNKAIEESWLLLFGHDPVYSSAKVAHTEKGFQFIDPEKELE